MMNYNISVAIVEDLTLVRTAFRKLLTSFGRVAKVYEAGNGQELISLLGNVSIDIVLLDLNMPVMNGEETCIFLKQNYPSIKVLVLSMYNDRFRIEWMIRLGANGFLSKNVDVDEVEEAIYAASGT
jgi:DNA-binding NarL/FixJ family response regulator